MNLETVAELETLADRSNAKYGPFNSLAEIYGALVFEAHETLDAMQRRDLAETRAELLDVANVALRGVAWLEERIDG